MLSIKTFCAATLLLVCSIEGHGHEPLKAISDIEASFRRSTTITFYFVSKTDKYTLTEKELMATATIKVTRKCGNNCASFMRQVTNHLGQARSAQCTTGQEDVLIMPNNGAALVFSRSGRVLRYGADCYFNEKSVGSILKSEGFFFK